MWRRAVNTAIKDTTQQLKLQRELPAQWAERISQDRVISSSLWEEN